MFTRSAVALPPKKRALRGRRLVVVDIENCVGGAVLTTSAACWAREAVQREVGCTDQVVIGVAHVGLISTAGAWPGARIVVESGPDGADRALLEVLQHEGVGNRFDELVLFSGDGIFVDSVAELAAMGVRVTVIGHRGHVAARLRMAAHETRYIGHTQRRTGGAA